MAAMQNGERAALALAAKNVVALSPREETDRKMDLAATMAAIGDLKCRIFKLKEGLRLCLWGLGVGGVCGLL
ncbi:hypothetical protein TIFTF001_022984 [Ficus carica]|uniref:Uncharacterized protein n=1 Tax=Ficus carica TaxID=3494 RepID=A0AA88AMT5_FICCA|nr:hypothetical protein TIFTF001_022984 [Ficus carica]